MNRKIRMLDCTLRDGAYIVNARFGDTAIRGIIEKLDEAGIDIIECGWLKDAPYEEGTTFYHIPDDCRPYLPEEKRQSVYVAMIDWNRYDLNTLPPCDGKTIDAIRVVFPKNHFREGIALGAIIKEKGYQVYFQAANTLEYSEQELRELAKEVNRAKPAALSIVDTFGAMYGEDLRHITDILHETIEEDIGLGFHSHNNQQLSFALCMQFVEMLAETGREIYVDASLCGMGRGAGNATTELVVQYLNRKQHTDYKMDSILDAIDIYMEHFQEKYKWGYSTPYFIAGMYCCHVNNIAYLLNNHRSSSKALRNVIGTLSEDKRKTYDYDNLERVYLEYQGREVDDSQTCKKLSEEFFGKNIVLVAPGKSSIREEKKIQEYISEQKALVIAVNAVLPNYRYDYVFFTNSARYEYAMTNYADRMEGAVRILLSSIKKEPAAGECVIHFGKTVKRGWKHFDNSVILAFRFLERLAVEKVAVAGFDGFKHEYNESYADPFLPTLNPDNKWDELNVEIGEMYIDFRDTAKNVKEIVFLTDSYYEKMREEKQK